MRSIFSELTFSWGLLVMFYQCCLMERINPKTNCTSHTYAFNVLISADNCSLLKLFRAMSYIIAKKHKSGISCAPVPNNIFWLILFFSRRCLTKKKQFLQHLSWPQNILKPIKLIIATGCCIVTRHGSQFASIVRQLQCDNVILCILIGMWSEG